MTNRELQAIENNMTPEQLRERADLLIKSGFIPNSINTPEKAVTIILTGRELGLGFMESLRSINVIQGKPSLSAQLMVALCQRTGQLEDLKVEEKPGSCTVTVKRKGVPTPHTYSFNLDQAKSLGLLLKDNWQKQPATMLRWRAIAGNLRVTFADAICGIYTEDEVEDMTVEKRVKEEEIVEETNKKIDEMAPAVVDIHDINQVAEEAENALRLHSYLIKDTKKFPLYQDRTIGEIYADKTPGGIPKGKRYLKKVMDGSSELDDRANIQVFLEYMERPE